MVGIYQRVGTHIKSLRPALERVEGRHDILRAPYFEHVDVNTNLTGCGLSLRCLQYRAGIAHVGDDRQAAEIRKHLAQKFDSFPGKLGGLNRQAGGVAARVRQ